MAIVVGVFLVPLSLTVPPPLSPGDAIAVVSPAGPCDRTLTYRGLGFLRTRYRVRFSHDIFARKGYLAGEDASRLKQLQAALDDPDIRAIVATRGGYGASRIAHRLDFRHFATKPKWIVGFSDITALHLEALRVGVASMHAPNASSLGRGDCEARAHWTAALESPATMAPLTRLSIMARGVARGPLVGGNLSLLHDYAACGRLSLPDRFVLFFEEVDEATYRIDRMLNALLVGGHLAGAVGICIGDMSGCRPTAGPRSLEQTLLRCLLPLGVPVVRGVPAGHASPNRSVLLGAPAELDARVGRLSIRYGG